MARQDDDVLITGIGLLTPLGSHRESSWNALKSGKSGLRRLVEIASDPPHFGGTVPNAEGRSSLLLVAAAFEAIADAGLDPTHNRERIGVVAGSSKGDVGTLGSWLVNGVEGRTFDLVDAWPSAGASKIAGHWDLQGPALSPVAACATGLIAAIRGASLIVEGVCDVVLAGAADASIDPLILGAFRKMGVLAKVDDASPSRAIRPWDRDRSGFLVGEGGAILVLERRSHAEKRLAVPYAEFAGGAFGADAFHATSLNPDPAGLADVIRRALKAASATPETIGHINVHGTATPSNDPLECRALRLALGEAASAVSCSANKGQIGHLLGAAGAVELAFTALAIRDQFAPPTANLERPDPACDLDGTPLVGRPRMINAALKLSIGFGGHLAAAVLKRPAGDRR